MMIGKTNAVIGGEKEIKNVEFTSELITYKQLGLDPYTYTGGSSGTIEVFTTPSVNINSNYSIEYNGIKYTNKVGSNSKFHVFTSDIQTLTNKYLCTPKSFSVLKPPIQEGLQTHIAKTNITDAKIKIPTLFGGIKWEVFATVTSGNVEVTSIEFPDLIISGNNNDPYSSVEFTTGIEIL